MQYLSARQMAEKWGVTVRRIQDLCRAGQIQGAVRWGRDWMLPADTQRPIDRRRKIHMAPGPVTACPSQMPSKCPSVAFSQLYHAPGTADALAASLEEGSVARELMLAQLDYCRNGADGAVERLKALMERALCFEARIGSALLLSRCAMYKGDLSLWNLARTLLLDTPCHTESQSHQLPYYLAALDSGLYDIANFPDWFRSGRFDCLPGDSYPMARFYYIKYLYVICHERALGVQAGGYGVETMRVLPLVAEPLISEASCHGSLIEEVYLRLICAIAYHDCARDDQASFHIDRAIALAGPDGLWLLLAEFRSWLGVLMDERLMLADPEGLAKVRALSKQVRTGWTHLHNTVLGRTVSAHLTNREREVSKQAAYGLSNKEIGLRLGISVNAVKQALRNAMDKTGVESRNELYRYI